VYWPHGTGERPPAVAFFHLVPSAQLITRTAAALMGDALRRDT
jgi:hypothetical protein